MVSAKRHASYPLEATGPALVEPDSFLPTQYLDRVRRRLEHDPERMLMAAVLDDGLATYRRHAHARRPHDRQLFDEAAEWIGSRDRSWLFAFESICDVLGLDPEYLRRGLRAGDARRARTHGHA